MSEVRDLVAEIRAQVRGAQGHTKGASGSSLESLSPEQLQQLAERIEKEGHTQEASKRIVEMRKEAQASPAMTDVELKKLAYQQALRELGFKEGNLSPLNLLFGDMDEAQEKLAKIAADAVTTLISSAVDLALRDDEGGLQ